MPKARYAVIFSSRLRADAGPAYGAMAEKMEALVAQMPGFLGAESFRREDGTGVTISYWDSQAAIKRWKDNPMHKRAQDLGKASWYESYEIYVCKVDEAWSFPGRAADVLEFTK